MGTEFVYTSRQIGWLILLMESTSILQLTSTESLQILVFLKYFQQFSTFPCTIWSQQWYKYGLQIVWLCVLTHLSKLDPTWRMNVTSLHISTCMAALRPSLFCSWTHILPKNDDSTGISVPPYIKYAVTSCPFSKWDKVMCVYALWD